MTQSYPLSPERSPFSPAQPESRVRAVVTEAMLGTGDVSVIQDFAAAVGLEWTRALEDQVWTQATLGMIHHDQAEPVFQDEQRAA